MSKPMLKLVRKEEQEEDRGAEAPVLRGPRTGLLLLLRRLGSKSRGYALAGAGVVVGAVVVVSLLSWLAPNSDRPIASPLEAVGRVASGVLEQVDEQVEALLGTDKGTVLRSVREGLAAAGSATPWPSGKSSEVAVGPSSSSSTASPDSSTASPNSASPSRDGASAPTRGESPSTASETPSQPALAPSPASTGETPPPTTDEPSPTTDEPSPTTGEPTPPPATPEQPPAVEEPSPPPTEEPPATEEPPPPTTEEPPPPPVTEEPPPVVTDPAPVKGPPETIADE